MKAKHKKPLNLTLRGMDNRSHKMMVMFLQGPCKGSATVVREHEAQAEVIDFDAEGAQKLLQNSQQQYPDRPLILFSLKEELPEDNIIFVKKPVQTPRMLEAIQWALKVIEQKKSEKYKLQSNTEQNSDASGVISDHPQTNSVSDNKADGHQHNKTNNVKKSARNLEEQQKKSKHKTAIQLDEKGFSSYLGSTSAINYKDPEQLKNANYKINDYYQGYAQSAFKLSITKNKIIQLNSGWKPLLIFPHSREIWVDADDKQLKAFSSVPIKTITSAGAQGISVTPVDTNVDKPNCNMEKFQSMEAFLWKLAIWTSRGRFPNGIDIERPVFLKRWPNFTRLVVTPHALRITALLMEGPRTLKNISQVLNVKPYFVFAFFSAVYALGLAGQAERQVDQMISPPPAPIKSSKKKGLLSKIMRKLRGN